MRGLKITIWSQTLRTFVSESLQVHFSLLSNYNTLTVPSEQCEEATTSTLQPERKEPKSSDGIPGISVRECTFQKEDRTFRILMQAVDFLTDIQWLLSAGSCL